MNGNQSRNIKKSDAGKKYDNMEKFVSEYAVKVNKRKPYESVRKRIVNKNSR